MVATDGWRGTSIRLKKVEEVEKVEEEKMESVQGGEE